LYNEDIFEIASVCGVDTYSFGGYVTVLNETLTVQDDPVKVMEG
jgi:hypothetical protein